MEYEAYLSMLRKSIDRIKADFDFSADIDHNTSKGTFREEVIKKFLRPFLPNAYGLSGGQAFDKEGSISKQLDVVIYDALFSYIAPYLDDFIYFPCESIYGVIEVKSVLNQDSFIAAAENIASVKKLKRDVISEYMVSPIKPLSIKDMHWEIEATTEFLGVIFAYTGATAASIFRYLEALKVRRDCLPNIIVLFSEKSIITRYQKLDDGQYSIHPLKEFDGFICIHYDNDFLAELLLLLFISLRSIELKAMDIQLLEKSITQKALSKYSDVIPNVIIKNDQVLELDHEADKNK